MGLVVWPMHHTTYFARGHIQPSFNPKKTQAQANTIHP